VPSSKQRNVKRYNVQRSTFLRLRGLNDRQARIVTHRFFGGLTQREIAEILGVSEVTVRRDWRLARAWLSRELNRP
jgi:RNA polymerase sigma factor (sigma-70 family)